MSDDAIWYYSNAAKQPNGPVGIAQLKEAMHAPGWYERALIWRDGWPQWRPWKEVAAELGIPLPMHAEVTAPPPRAPAPALAPAPAPAPRPQASPLAATEIYPAPAAMQAAAPPRPPVSGQRPAAPAPAAGLPDSVAESEMVYAGFWRRFVALLIDGVLLTIIIVPVLAIAGAILTPMMMAGAMNGEPSMGPMIALIAINGFMSLLGAFYFVICERSASGATLGKRLIGIRVVDKEGRRIGFGRALGRLLGKIVSGMPLYLGYVMAGFTGRKQALHDMIAGTLVIDKSSRTQLGGKSGSGSMGLIVGLIVGIGLLGVIGVGILAAIAIPAYQDFNMRNKLAAAYNEAWPIQIAVSEYFNSNDGNCPGNGDGTVGSADSYYGLYFSRAEVQRGTDDSGTQFCLINLTLAGDPKLSGKMLQLAMDANQTWSCASSDADINRWLPKSCAQ
ncbi:hypothetical protein C7S18_20550 [Ahniella affigens]|uniref:RDD domain-containing protein n=1 Tax=Ahniella affigens TaxID=2021234 RepID=A0A2P1PX83_9GAMM|nr:RDD family protein [Ahniella affigens]AVP99414.1 hypothetical protein C7S18_20550 [Ahniella affigens]